MVFAAALPIFKLQNRTTDTYILLCIFYSLFQDLPERVLKPYMYLGAEITFIALQQQKTAATAASESPSSASKGEAGDLLETIEDDELSVSNFRRQQP